MGEHAEAAASADRLAVAAVEPANDLYTAACFLSRCVPLVEKDSKRSADQRRLLAGQYAERAMARLKEAVARGYKDATHMSKDTDLDSLHRRPDFQRLLASMLGKK